jgi:hypothetical protein
MIAVYYTETPLTFIFSLIGVICFVSIPFLILFGVIHQEPVKALMTPKQHLAYDQRFSQLQAEFDFNEKVNKDVPRRI